jgi:hypothetical protein
MEEFIKYVEIVYSYFSAVDFVKYLQKYKNIKDVSEML